jgi:hypothetical protein
MYFSKSAALFAVLAATSMASPLGSAVDARDNDDGNSDINIFHGADAYNDWAICKNKISRKEFNLNAPTDQGGCVRYFQGIDMTGVTTEEHFFFKDGIKSACDCAIKCIRASNTCTNWVFKHTFMAGDGGKRSCTLYSSPNLPSSVTIKFDVADSTSILPLQPTNNPQKGGTAPLTFLDNANTKPDPYGVSGFVAVDQNNKVYC